jgi:hypothetical protein
MDKIANLICDSFSIPIDNLKTPSRDGGLVYPRQIIMYIALKNKIGSLAEIGKYFNRDHATVLHAKKSIQNYKQTDKIKKDQINLFEIKFANVTVINKKLNLFMSEIDSIQKALDSVELRTTLIQEKVDVIINDLNNI